MSGGITIHEMEDVAISLASGPDFGSDIGNVVEINDSSDTLGLNMLMNPGKTSGGSGGGGGGGGGGGAGPSISFSTPSSGGGGSSFGASEIKIDSLASEPLEPVSFSFGGADASAPPTAPIEFELPSGGSGASAGAASMFGNDQTATGPSLSFSPAPAQRMNPEEERKQKFEYINKLQRLEQKGFQVSKRFTLDNSLEEMKQEFERLVDARNLEASLRFQRQALMSVVTGMEWLNGRFDPFDLKLDGWSESVHENVEDFDEIFEELYDKYKDRGKMPPEARLVMALAGSGFMCHVSNTFLRSRMPSADDILRQNPELARQFATAAAQQAGPGFGNFMSMAMGGGAAGAAARAPQPAPAGAAGPFFGSSAERAAAAGMTVPAPMPPANMPASVAAMEPPRATARREMRGPSGVDDILRTFEAARQQEAAEGSMTGSMPPSPKSQPAVMAAVEIQSMASGDDIASMAESSATGGRRGGGRRRRPAAGNTLSLNL